MFAVDREEVKTASPEQEEPDLMKNQQTVYAAENGNGEYQEDISRVFEESDQWDAGKQNGGKHDKISFDGNSSGAFVF